MVFKIRKDRYNMTSPLSQLIHITINYITHANWPRLIVQSHYLVHKKHIEYTLKKIT